mmetsp:Transcript_38138/g.68955  ORF Transcript_38138/g.68955 Transcript_38138/m.68955 type:complete len:544 (-) Transcript_38138:10-1641(-)
MSGNACHASFPRAESEVVNPGMMLDSLPVPRSSSEVIKPSEVFLDLMMLEPLKNPISRQATANVLSAGNGTMPGYFGTRAPARPPALAPIQGNGSFAVTDGNWTPVGIGPGAGTPPKGAGSFVLRRGIAEAPGPVMGHNVPSRCCGCVQTPATQAPNISRPLRSVAMPMASSPVMGATQSLLPGMGFAVSSSNPIPSPVRPPPQSVTMSYQGQATMMTMPQGVVSGTSSWNTPGAQVAASMQLPARSMPSAFRYPASQPMQPPLARPSVVAPQSQPLSVTVPSQLSQRPVPAPSRMPVASSSWQALGTASSSTAPAPVLLANTLAGSGQPSLQPQPQPSLQQRLAQPGQPVTIWNPQQPPLMQPQPGPMPPQLQQQAQAQLAQAQLQLQQRFLPQSPQAQPNQMQPQTPQQLQTRPWLLPQGQTAQSRAPPQISQVPQPQAMWQQPQATSQPQAMPQLQQPQMQQPQLQQPVPTTTWAIPANRQPSLQPVMQPTWPGLQQPSARHPVLSASTNGNVVSNGQQVAAGGLATDAAKRASMAFPLP